MRKVFFRFKEQIEVKYALKTALAAIISLYLCLELDALIQRPMALIGGLWCVVASIVVLQPDVGGTYKAIINRFLGVVIGSIIGASFAYFWGGNTLVLGSAIFTTIILCSLLNLKEGYRIAGLSVAVTIIPWTLHPEISPWTFAFFRFLDTCLGILVAVFVAHTIWPSQANLKARLTIAQILNLLNQLCHSIFILTDDSQKSKNKLEDSLCTEINRLLTQTPLVLEESKLEKILGSFPINVWTEIISALERIFKELNAIRDVFKKELQQMFDEELQQQIEEAIEKMEKSFHYLSSRIINGNKSADWEDLNQMNERLNTQLTRFRETRVTRKYDFEFVERYFVFFYSLKSILQQLQQLNGMIDMIQNETEN